MSIKILKEGKSNFITKCNICGCEFSYDLSDLDVTKRVACPHCHNDVLHDDQFLRIYCNTDAINIGNNHNNIPVTDITDMMDDPYDVTPKFLNWHL